MSRDTLKMLNDAKKYEEPTVDGWPLYSGLPEPEPVAWINAEEIGYMHVSKLNGSKDWKTNLGLVPEENDIPLYTAPQKKEWVGLKNSEVLSMTHRNIMPWMWKLIGDIDAKLKEKNNV